MIKLLLGTQQVKKRAFSRVNLLFPMQIYLTSRKKHQHFLVPCLKIIDRTSGF